MLLVISTSGLIVLTTLTLTSFVCWLIAMDLNFMLLDQLISLAERWTPS